MISSANKSVIQCPKEKELFLDAQPEFVDKNQASTSTTTLPRRPIMEMPERFDQPSRKKPMGKVSNLKYFLKGSYR